jgi:Cd2+/Zn2+-exporting ATPase
VLSIPSAVLAAIAWGARHGILFRGGAAVEKLAAVNIVALDKTGTLTTGELCVEQVESFPPGREAEVAQLAYSLGKLSAHPLARAITNHGKHHQITALAFDRFESATGQGLQAWRSGTVSRLGRREWVTLAGRHADLLARVAATEAGFSEVWIEENELLGRLVLRDDLRPQSAAVVAALRQAGLRSVVLTGDRQATAAHIGIAMGARGADAALEQADVVLMHDRLENFLTAFHLSQRARRIIRQNLFISLGTVILLVCLALGGKIPLTVGVVGHEGSTVVVVMNSLRLLLGGAKKPDLGPLPS